MATDRAAAEAAPGNGAVTRVRLVFADEGAFHAEIVTVPTTSLPVYDRLIDLIREDPSVTRQLYVDMRRLVSANLMDS